MAAQSPKPVSIYTVAEHAGVSVATVSRVLRGSTPTKPSTRQKVLTAVDELGYVPLRASRNSPVRLETHGVVLGSLGGPYYSEFLTGYESGGARQRQSVIVMSTESASELDDRVRELATQVDGLVIGHDTVDDDLVLEIARDLPVALIARSPLEGCDHVSVDNADSTIALVRHLLDHGYRKLLFAGDPAASHDIERRHAGFLKALNENEQVAQILPPYRVPNVESAGSGVAEYVASNLDRLDALVCANDELALSVIRHLKRRGVKVPQDVAVTGWDDVMAAKYTTPGLTTVEQPTRELGRQISQMLHDRIAGGPVRPPVKLGSHVVVRGTCGCDEPEN